jgi:exodeoxyribonuclease VIII
MNAPADLKLGLIPHMPAEVYHSIPAMSAGGLKRMQQSPAHFYGLQLDPNRPASEPTPAMRNGTLVHCALFEPHALGERYAVKPEGHDGRTAAGKAWLAANAGRELVSPDAMTAARAQAAAIRELPDVAALLAEGIPEPSAFWIDDYTSELCKCRPDWVSPAGDGVILVDGKTCVEASPEGFSRAIWNFAYHLQAAWYSEGYEQATGRRVHGFVFAAVESSWPYAAAAYMLGDDVLDKARAECRRLLYLYADCKRTGKWPGYAPGINLINLPRWANFAEN